jgi:hypothetical protein
MKAMLAVLATIGLAGGAVACGVTHSDARNGPKASKTADASAPAVRAAPVGSYLKDDTDSDADDRANGRSDDDEVDMVAAGHGASQGDRRLIAGAVKNYFAAASSGNGVEGCALLHSSLASSLGQERTGSSRAATCASTLSLLFKQQRQHLANEDVATMVVTGVHVDGAVAMAMLGFRKMPESEIVLKREGRSWKIDALFDSTLP